MALTVGNLFKESVKYNMKLLAGQAGLCRPVQWIHIIETNEGHSFCMEMRLSSRNALQEMMRKSCSALWVRSTACTPVHSLSIQACS